MTIMSHVDLVIYNIHCNIQYTFRDDLSYNELNISDSSEKLHCEVAGVLLNKIKVRILTI